MVDFNKCYGLNPMEIPWMYFFDTPIPQESVSRSKMSIQGGLNSMPYISVDVSVRRFVVS